MQKLLILVCAFMFLSCTNARRVSENLSKASDYFEINRRIVFFNGITDKYLLVIEGKCSISKDNKDKQLEVVCQTGTSEYKKHYLGISDNVSYFVEQTTKSEVNSFFYRVKFNPDKILDLDINLR